MNYVKLPLNKLQVFIKFVIEPNFYYSETKIAESNKKDAEVFVKF